MGFTRWLALLVGMVVLCMVASCREEMAVPDARSDSGVTVKGTITGEGVECLALRDSANKLYTLAGETGAYGPGDEVCVKGEISEFSYCMQGTTIAVEWIGPVAACD